MIRDHYDTWPLEGVVYAIVCPQQTIIARVFTSSACVNLVENWCKEHFLSVFFNRKFSLTNTYL